LIALKVFDVSSAKQWVVLRSPAGRRLRTLGEATKATNPAARRRNLSPGSEASVSKEYAMFSEEENNARQESVDSLLSLVGLRTKQLRESVSNLERCYDILESFGQSLALKHADTEKHSKRVAAFSIGIARGRHTYGIKSL